jgi:hypothetical protein
LNRNDALLGEDVDFVSIGNRPMEIIVMSGSPWTAFGAGFRG